MSRKNAYQNRIQTKLAELSIALDPLTLAKLNLAKREGGLQSTIVGNQEWKPVGFFYAPARQDCELCGHPNLKRVFIIESVRSQEKLKIGSECAHNYIDADIIAGLCKLFDLEYNKIVNPIKFEDALEILNWAKDSDLKAIRYTNLFRSVAYKLVNSGSEYSVIQKINAGKVIGNSEKKVIDFWKAVREFEGQFVEFSNVVEFIGALARQIRQDEWDERNKKADEVRQQNIALNQLAFFFTRLSEIIFGVWEDDFYAAETERREAEEAAVREKSKAAYEPTFQNARQNAQAGVETKFVEDMIAKLANGDKLSWKQQQWFDSIVTRNTQTIDIPALLDKFDAAKLKGWEKDFFDSVSLQFELKGNLSPKQVRVLEKIALHV